MNIKDVRNCPPDLEDKHTSKLSSRAAESGQATSYFLQQKYLGADHTHAKMIS